MLATKRKREVARTLREASIEQYSNETAAHDFTADLGVFGNANVNLLGIPLGGSASQEEYTVGVANAILDGAVAGVEMVGSIFGGGGLGSLSRHAIGDRKPGATPEDPNFINPKGMSYTYPDLLMRSQLASQALTEAYKNCLEDRVQFSDSSYLSLIHISEPTRPY